MGKVALLFAGQGAQKPGMGKEIYVASPAARAVLDAIEAQRPGTMAELDDAAALSSTRAAQPCVFAVDLMCAAAVVEAGLRPDMIAGFSLGEWAAASFAGVFPFERGLAVVAKRAVWMQECADRAPGGMAAVVRLPADKAEALCAEFPGAYPANYNSPDQTVVSCPLEVLPSLMKRAQEMGGRAVRLNVAGAFHSPYMQDAADALAVELSADDLDAPRIPLYLNVTARPAEGHIASDMARQAAKPVRWRETLENMAADGADVFVEVGTGTVLTGLVQKTLPGMQAFNVEDARSLDALRAWLGGETHGR